MRAMGLLAIDQWPSTSRRSPERPAQRGLGHDHHLPAHAHGNPYLATLMDWHSRHVLTRRLSNTLEACFSAETLEEPLARASRRRSTPIRGASPPVESSPKSYRTAECGSAWTGMYGAPTTSYYYNDSSRRDVPRRPPGVSAFGVRAAGPMVA